jgi:hypothetical protein
MPKVTLTTEEEVLRWARIKAAEQDTSVARLVGDLLKRQMIEERGYHSAKRRFLGGKARVISRGRYPARDDLHDRARLR